MTCISGALVHCPLCTVVMQFHDKGQTPDDRADGPVKDLRRDAIDVNHRIDDIHSHIALRGWLAAMDRIECVRTERV